METEEPKDVYYYLREGNNLKAADKTLEALASYEQAILLFPKHHIGYRLKGLMLASLGKFEEAIYWYDESLKRRITYADAYLFKGISLCKLGRIEEAKVCYSQAKTHLDPKNAIFNNLMGTAYELVEDLEEAVYWYDQAFNANPKDAGPLISKGKLLYDLGKKEEAIMCFDEAIKVNVYNPAYYCTKGKYLNMMGKEELALECFNKAYELDKISNGGSNNLTKRESDMVKNTLNVDRAALLKKLADLQQASIEAAKISEQLNPTNEKAAQFIQKVKQLVEKKDKFASQVISKYDKKESDNFGPPTAAIDNTKSDLGADLVETRDDLNELKQQMQDFLKEQQVQNQKVNQRLDKHETALEQGGVFAKSAIREGFNSLENEDPRLYIYCKTFYWTTINLFGAYRSLSTGLVTGNLDNDVSTKERLLVLGAKKLTDYGAEIAKGIPFVGGLIGALDSIIDDLYASVKENRFQNKVNAINKIIQNKFSMEEDISVNIAQLALAITKKRKQLICYPTIKVSSRFERGLKWLNDRIEAVKGLLLPSIALHDMDDNSVRLALSDVTLMITFFCVSYESIIMNRNALDVQCVDIIEYGGFEQMTADVGTSTEGVRAGNSGMVSSGISPLEMNLLGKEETTSTKNCCDQYCNMF